MAGSVNYLIPTDSMTLSDQKEMRRAAIIAGLGVAVNRGVASEEDIDLVRVNRPPKTVDVREFQNMLDAGTVLDQWNTAALAAVGTAYSVLQAVGAVVVPQSRFWVFYKVGVETIPPPVSRLQFRIGGATGNIRALFDLEPLFTQQRLEGYFSEAVVYAPGDNAAIQVLCRTATGVLARVPLGALVIETGGQTVA